MQIANLKQNSINECLSNDAQMASAGHDFWKYLKAREHTHMKLFPCLEVLIVSSCYLHLQNETNLP